MAVTRPGVTCRRYTPSDLGHNCCEALLSPRVVLVVACSQADVSCQSRFLPRLYANPLGCEDSSTGGLEGVGTLGPGSIRR
jgi:hypothetical protein